MILKISNRILLKELNNSRRNIKKFRIKAQTSELKRVRQFISDYANSIGCSPNKSYEIQLVVDEICTNIIQYSYNENQLNRLKKLIWIECEGNSKLMIVRIIDQGEFFDIKQYKAPTIAGKIAHPHKGGWGIPIIKTLVDKIETKKNDDEPNKNILELHFKLY